MLRDLLSSRLFLGGFLLTLLFMVGIHLWTQQEERKLQEDMAETQRFLQQLKKEKASGRYSETIEIEIQEQTNPLLESDESGDPVNPPPETTEVLSIDDINALFDIQEETDADETSEEPEASTDTEEIERTIRFINAQFTLAAELCHEKLAIKQQVRRVQHLDGLSYNKYPPGGQKRLEEIEYEFYETLKPIGDKVPGAVEVQLRYGTWGFGGCDKFLFPSVFERELGRVPENYYQFEAALWPLLKPPLEKR